MFAGLALMVGSSMPQGFCISIHFDLIKKTWSPSMGYPLLVAHQIWKIWWYCQCFLLELKYSVEKVSWILNQAIAKGKSPHPEISNFSFFNTRFVYVHLAPSEKYFSPPGGYLASLLYFVCLQAWFSEKFAGRRSYLICWKRLFEGKPLIIPFITGWKKVTFICWNRKLGPRQTSKLGLPLFLLVWNYIFGITFFTLIITTII